MPSSQVASPELSFYPAILPTPIARHIFPTETQGRELKRKVKGEGGKSTTLSVATIYTRGKKKKGEKKEKREEKKKRKTNSGSVRNIDGLKGYYY